MYYFNKVKNSKKIKNKNLKTIYNNSLIIIINKSKLDLKKIKLIKKLKPINCWLHKKIIIRMVKV